MISSNYLYDHDDIENLFKGILVSFSFIYIHRNILLGILLFKKDKKEVLIR